MCALQMLLSSIMKRWKATIVEATPEARQFVSSGSLRAALERSSNLSQKAINKIVDACIFVLKA